MKINEATGGLTQGIISGIQDLTRRDPLKGPQQTGYSAIGNWLRRKKSGLSKEDQMAYDNFVSKFVKKGMNAIQTAISTGIADPSSNSMSVQTNKPRVRINPQTGQMQAAPDQTANIAKPKKKQIKFTVMGDTYTKKADGWYVGNKRINPQTQDYIDKLYNQSLAETVEYFALNMLFESKINEQQMMSITQYAKNYFVDPYLKGINFPPEAETQINQILQNLPSVVGDKNALSNELKKIADIAWAIALAQNR